MNFFIVQPLLLCGVFTFFLHGMDDAENMEEITVESSEKPPKPLPLLRIGTVEELKKIQRTVIADSKTSSERKVAVDPAVAAAVAHTITYDEDPDAESRTHKKLEENLKSIEKNDPEKYKEITEGVLTLHIKYDGDLSAGGFKNYRSKKQSNQPTPTSESSAERRTLVRKVPSLELEIKGQEKAIRDIKKAMRKLTLKAAEEAHKEEQELAERNIKIAQRNMYWGFGGTFGGAVIAALITGITTYYAAVVNSSNSGGNDCSKCVCINHTA